MIANVIPAIKTGGEVEFFSYLVLTDLESTISVGSIVTIPFGNRTIKGVVSELLSDSDSGSKLKKIEEIDSDFVLPKQYIEIAKWISNYYLCSLGESIEIFLPPRIKKPRTDNASKNINNREEIARLSKDQQTICNCLKTRLIKPEKPALLHGITGSGKTEIYINLAKEAMKLEKQVVILVPEIMLTPQTVEKFEKHFGNEILLMHSGLSKSEKYHCYRQFIKAEKKILIGPRSALLVPSKKIGLIIIDEEQEDSFKQEQNPRYHAVTLAQKIARTFGALLVLGSATPSVETYFHSKNNNFDLFELKERFNKVALPTTEVVDLKNEIKAKNYSVLSLKLERQIKNILENKKQTLLFINRRGIATFVSCRDCGNVMVCNKCSIPLVYYLRENEGYLSCHHCGAREKIWQTCPECGSSKVKYFGAGTDKVLLLLKEIFPTANIAKVDSNSMQTRNSYKNFYRKLQSGEIDIVVGTQIIAKGLDIPNVDFVGIITADTGLNLPHYRASEKTFQIITQVAGRSGRREKQGKTIIQTYWPEANAIKFASQHNFTGFYQSEIKEREKHGYPPYCRIVRVISENLDDEKASDDISAFSEDLKRGNFTFIGPGPCFYRKLHNRFRYQVIIKLNSLPDQDLFRLKNQYRNLTFDVEPTNLL